jgi:hypothetical protein
MMKSMAISGASRITVPRSALLKNLGGETFDGEPTGHKLGGNDLGGKRLRRHAAS